MKRIQFVLVVLFINLICLQSQSSRIYLGFDLPLYYSLGYQQQVLRHFSVSGQVGLLTKPFDRLILSTMNKFDVDEVLLNTIGNAFSSGTNMQAKFNWHFGKNYIGLSYSYLILKATDCPADVIQDYYGYSIPSRRIRELTLHSYLQNTGILYGRVFQLKNPAFSIHLELSVLKTIASRSTVKNKNGEELSNLSEVVDNELDSYYLAYGFLPSVNLYITYNFISKN